MTKNEGKCWRLTSVESDEINTAHFPILPRVFPGHSFYSQNLSDPNPCAQTFYNLKGTERIKETMGLQKKIVQITFLLD